MSPRGLKGLGVQKGDMGPSNATHGVAIWEPAVKLTHCDRGPARPVHVRRAYRALPMSMFLLFEEDHTEKLSPHLTPEERKRPGACLV